MVVILVKLGLNRLYMIVYPNGRTQLIINPWPPAPIYQTHHSITAGEPAGLVYDTSDLLAKIFGMRLASRKHTRKMKDHYRVSMSMSWPKSQAKRLLGNIFKTRDVGLC